MRSIHSSCALLLVVGLGFAQIDFSSQSFNTSNLNKIKKANMGGGTGINPENLPKVAASAYIQDDKYELGPGDLLSIYLGATSLYQVSPEGTLNVPGVVPVKVGGHTLRQAKADIKKAMASSYDTTKVVVTLASANTFKISVLGEVMNPGLKIITSYTRVEELISFAGGFTRNAIRDNLIVVRTNGDTVLVRLSRHFREFRDEDNPLLNFGDKLIVSRVDFQKPFCVVRVGSESYVHQITGDESLQDVFFQVGNYTQASTPSYAHIKHCGGKEFNLGPELVFQAHPEVGDSIEFKKDVNYVFVGGAVMKPGIYEYAPNYGPVDYLYFAGLTPQSASSETYALVRDGKLYHAGDPASTGVRPGDKIYLERNKVDTTRDYLTIIASLAGIVISSLTLYFTFHRG